MLSSSRSGIFLLLRTGPFGLALGVMFAAPSPGAAAPSDPLHLVAGIGYAHDDNLLRVPEGQPGFDNRLADSWIETEAALVFDKMAGRQKLSATARLSKVKFDHFQQLDYDGRDLKANWDWQLGNHLEGKAGASYLQTLAPYTDFRSNERNLREQRRSYLDATWRFHPSWQARAGVATEKFTYDLARQRFNDRSEDALEAGFDYLAPSGSTAGLVVRRLEGDYPNGRPVGGAVVADDYRQDEIKAKVVWIASGTTTVQALAGWVRRRQAALGERDTDGVNGKVSASYTPRAKFSLTAALWREFAPLESTLASYTRNKGASIGAGWDASARVRVDASALYERRDYAALARPGNAGAGDDSLRTASVRASYAPRRAVLFSAGWTRQSRSGNAVLGIGSFTSNSMSLNASAQF